MSLLPYNAGAVLCRALRQNVKLIRSIQTSAARVSAEKTPIQKWGWDYLMRQRSLKRPISPHLTVYKPQMTWMVSGLHRLTGCAMGVTLFLGGVGFSVLPIDFPTFIDFVRGLHIPWPILDAFRFVIAFPIAFHTLNGMRFIGFDMAKGTDIASIYKGAYLVLGLAALIAFAVVAYPHTQHYKDQKHQHQHGHHEEAAVHQ